MSAQLKLKPIVVLHPKDFRPETVNVLRGEGYLPIMGDISTTWVTPPADDETIYVVPVDFGNGDIRDVRLTPKQLRAGRVISPEEAANG